MIEGETTLALAYAERDEPLRPARTCTTRAEKQGGGYVLRGQKVLGAERPQRRSDRRRRRAPRASRATRAASRCSSSTRSAQRASTSQPLKTMDGQRAAHARARRRRGRGRRAARRGGRARCRCSSERSTCGAAAACAEGVGALADRARDDARVPERRASSSACRSARFQALQHRAVDMFVELRAVPRRTMLLAAIKADAPTPTSASARSRPPRCSSRTSGQFVTRQGDPAPRRHRRHRRARRRPVLQAHARAATRSSATRSTTSQRFARLPSFELADRLIGPPPGAADYDSQIQRDRDRAQPGSRRRGALRRARGSRALRAIAGSRAVIFATERPRPDRRRRRGRARARRRHGGDHRRRRHDLERADRAAPRVRRRAAAAHRAAARRHDEHDRQLVRRAAPPARRAAASRLLAARAERVVAARHAQGRRPARLPVQHRRRWSAS